MPRAKTNRLRAARAKAPAVKGRRPALAEQIYETLCKFEASADKAGTPENERPAYRRTVLSNKGWELMPI